MSAVLVSPVNVRANRARTFSPIVRQLARQLAPRPQKPSRRLMPADLVPLVRQLLSEAAKGTGRFPQYLTAYQLFRRMPGKLRSRLVSERATPGRGAGYHYSGASIIAATCKRMKKDLDIEYLDNDDLIFQTRKNREAVGSAPVCGIYRLRRKKKAV